VTVALYALAARPALGWTVNVPVPLAAMVATDVADSVKLPESVPDSATVRAPVATVLVLVMVTVFASGRAYPAVTASNVSGDGLRVMAAVEAALTVKLTGMVCCAERPLPDTVTVALYAFAARLTLGWTVNVPVPLAAMLFTDVVDSVKLPGSVPDSATVRAPVATVPVLVMVTVCAAGCVYPTVAAVNVIVVGARVMEVVGVAPVAGNTAVTTPELTVLVAVAPSTVKKFAATPVRV